MSRLERLEEAYRLVKEKGNAFMAENLRKEIEREKKKPTAEA